MEGCGASLGGAFSFQGGEGDPFGAAFENDECRIGDGAGGLEGEEASHGDRAGSLILGVDVVVTGVGAHWEQAWREAGALASPDEARADRYSKALR
jgi:hypothetical protein